jgi:hypothetical protein
MEIHSLNTVGSLIILDYTTARRYSKSIIFISWHTEKKSTKSSVMCDILVVMVVVVVVVVVGKFQNFRFADTHNT